MGTARAKSRISVSVWEWLPLVLAVLLFLIHISVQRRILQFAQTAEREALRQQQIDRRAANLVQYLTDAETGLRGYLLTDKEVYLEPYTKAVAQIPENLVPFREVMNVIPSRAGAPQRVDAVVSANLEILQETLALARRGGQYKDLALQKADAGKARMDEVREVLTVVREEARRAWTGQLGQFETSVRNANWMIYLLGGSVCLLLGIGTYRLLRSSARADTLVQALDQQKDQYHRLAIMLQKGHEEERAAMARKVHDEVGQNLTAAKLDVAMSLRLIREPERACPTLERAILVLEDTLATARAIATELRPPILDQLGLIAAVEWQLREFQVRFGGKTSWSSEIQEREVSPAAKLALFRVLQEALTNVVRHARAKTVDIRLARTGSDVAMIVSDDGVGMSVAEEAVNSLGLLGMRERMRAVGGDLEIDSEIGKGARVTAKVPAAVLN